SFILSPHCLHSFASLSLCVCLSLSTTSHGPLSIFLSLVLARFGSHQFHHRRSAASINPTATMSDQGEKTCPLCAEEMDLTDQQLKPCQCGYEICVWCWHHIMDMAEKDASEGRCPACRTPYDKEKIVGTGPNERLVCEINERKKSQKSKTKPSEGRKQLSSVRVIQRNLVYIVGLPLNFADEDLLQRREYFGQYGKVLKVSMSRTPTGVVQQFPNNTCSVYITYGKEDEAIRCIQSVNGFVLDGKSLKACFGTTKYCHAWLRNVPCTNSDCLYLHEVGSQEESFTKDEIISAHTRVQQITGVTNILSRRSGSMLPPPALDYSYDISASAPVKNATNQSTVGASCKGSPPNGSCSRSAALPAAASWGMRASNQSQSITSLNGPSKPKLMADTVANTDGLPAAVPTTVQSSAAVGDMKATWNEGGQSLNSKAKHDLLRPIKHHGRGDSRPIMFEKASIDDSGANTELPNDWEIADVSSVKSSKPFSHEQEGIAIVDEKISSVCPEMSSVRRTDSGAKSETSMAITRSSSMLSENSAVKFPSGQKHVDKFGESLVSTTCKPAANGVFVSREARDSKMDPLTRAVSSSVCELEEDLLSFDNQRLSDPEVVSRSSYLPSTMNSLRTADDSWSLPSHHRDAKADPLFLDSRIGDRPMRNMSCESIMGNGYPEKLMNSRSAVFDRTVEHQFLLPGQGEGKHYGVLQGESDDNAALDAGESSIISNILSLDLDGWDESLTSQNLAKLLGDTEKQTSSLNMSNSWKGQSNKQSRFSFARQEESRNHAFDVDTSFIGSGQMPRNHPFNHDLLENRNSYMDTHGLSNGFSTSIIDEPNNFLGGNPAFPLSKPSGHRAHISAPPGFSTVPNRAPPPGFSSHERTDHQTFDSMLGSNLLDTPSLHRSSYTAPMTGSTIDIELIDPAILAVGKGRFQGGFNNNPGLDMRSNFPQQLGMFENEARLQLLMQQRSQPPQHQNLRYGADLGGTFSTAPESYSRMTDQPQVINNNLSAFAKLAHSQSRNGVASNGHWDNNSSWNEVQGGNNLGMAELLGNERLGGFNKFYASGYEDLKFRIPNSGDLYNRTFEM
ncbi:CCR4-NOT transcription complex subunit 4, partial [Linum perenne]